MEERKALLADDKSQHAPAKAAPAWEQWLDCITDILFITDESGRIIRANRAMARAFGSTVEELAGKECASVLYPAMSAGEEPPFVAVLKGAGPVRREVSLAGMEGTFLSSAYPLYDANGARCGALAWIKDITARKRVEDDLRIKDNAVASSICGIAFVGSDRKVTYVNDALLKMWGYDSTGEILGRAGRDFFESPEKVDAALKILWQTGRWMGEMRAVKKGGAVFTVEVAANLVRNSRGEAIGTMASFFDVTERKRAEEELRRERDFNTSLVQASPAFFVAIDAAGKTLMMNESMLRALEYEPHEVEGADYLRRFVPAAEHKAVSKTFDKMIKERQAASSENHVLCRDGRRLLVDWHGRPVLNADGALKYFFGVGMNVTEKRKAESELRARNELLDTVLSSMTEAVTIENEDYEIEYMNRAAVEKYGKGVGKKCHRHYFSRSEQCESCYVRDLLHNGHASPKFHARSRLDGSALELTSCVITNPAGRRVVLTVERDVTEKKRIEAQLLQAQKMETVGTLAGGVAHEFNNLHCGILGYLDIILKREKLSASVRDKLARVYDAASRAADVTRNLLVFSRKQEPKKEPARLDEIVVETLRLLQPQLESAGIRAKTALGAKRLCALDRGQMVQVLINLILNARDAMADTGRRELIIATGLDSRRVILKVSDTGCGIEQANLPRIFEPFFTTKGPLAAGTAGPLPAHGTGLGLSVCYGVVKDHGGTITVESEKGEGTTFTVTLPRVHARAQAREKRLSPRQAGARGARVLLVDDDEMIRGMLIELLQAEGYDAAAFGDASKAIKDARKRPPDAVIVDLLMPGIDGRNFLRMLGETPLRRRPVKIVITGKQIRCGEEERDELGASALIKKPFKPQEMLETLYALLHERAGAPQAGGKSKKTARKKRRSR